jgi:hypothetical protein
MSNLLGKSRFDKLPRFYLIAVEQLLVQRVTQNSSPSDFVP